MRRTLLALMLVCGFGLPLATFSTVHADDSVTGPVTLTVHAAVCSTDEVNDPDLGLYDACHANVVGGVTVTYTSAEEGSISFVTDAAGVGSVEILDGLASATLVALAADDPTAGYTYCSDQNSGATLFDGSRVEGGAVPLFTVDASQAIVCDWFIFTDEVAAG